MLGRTYLFWACWAESACVSEPVDAGQILLASEPVDAGQDLLASEP